MDIQNYWSCLSPKQKQELADKCGKSKAFLSNIFNKGQPAGVDMVKLLEPATNKVCTREDLRPDIYDW